MSDNRPIVYQEGDVVVYRASSVGLPPRCLTLARMEYDPRGAPDYLIAAASAGNLAEIEVKSRLRQSGYEIRGEQSEVEVFVPNTAAIIRGHMDAERCTDPDGTTRPLEVKSMSNNVWEKWGKYGWDAFPTYAAQATVYAFAMSAPELTYAIINRDTSELVTFTTPPPLDINEIFAKVQLVETLNSIGQLPICDNRSYRCLYDYMCDQRSAKHYEPGTGDDQELIDLATEYRRLAVEVAELDSEKRRVHAELKRAMADTQNRSIGNFTLYWTPKLDAPPKPKKVLSEVRLRAELGDRLNDFYDEEEGRKPTLVIKEKEST